MRRFATLAAAAALAGCLGFQEDGRYACDPKTGQDCDGQLSSSDVQVVGGRFDPAAADLGAGSIQVVDGTLVGPEVKVCNSQAPQVCFEGGITP